jgi:predicted porin
MKVWLIAAMFAAGAAHAQNAATQWKLADNVKFGQ